MDNKGVTFEVLFKLFINDNKDMESRISDYRSGGNNTLRIWLDNGKSILAHYNKDSNKFEIKDYEEVEK
jgi:hypothetical protein